MRKHIIYITLFLLSISWGCKKQEDSYLNTSPTNILLENQVWTTPDLVMTILGDLYSRFPEFQNLDNWWEYTNMTEAFPSALGDYWRVQSNQFYDYGWWGEWDYRYVRELNLFIQKCKKADALKDADRNRFLGEARFLRCASYFEKVKRMGGVPIITEPMEYNFSGDPTYLQHPRNKESEVYDFIIAELDTIKDMLPDNVEIKARATKAAALAMQSRVALYAGSIARYNPIRTPNVKCTPDNGEVGMTDVNAAKITAYYTKALVAAQAIMGGQYSLYKKKPDLSDNFASLFFDKSKNSEAIFVKDYKLKNLVNGWTLNNQPRSIAEEQQGGRINPSLNLAQSFEKLDNTLAPFVTTDGSGNPVYYSNQIDIFAGRDARLAGTIMLPGSKFKDKTLDILAGVITADGKIHISSNPTFGAREQINGVDMEVVGFDGPIDGTEFSAQTGFYVRKYQDPTTGSGQIGTQSEVWWIRYRYGEVLLNAAEAAFELGQPGVAAGYLNQLRERAGFPANSLSVSDITFDRIVHERKVELAFEGHELWDLKRWRLADRVLNGNVMTAVTTTPGKADEVNTMVFGLLPYKIYNPGDVNNGKYIYKQVKPSRVQVAHTFRLGNYYSFIGTDVRNGNPKITKNPNQ
ncbi:MAG: RagB/SusD family nutrient uptake outer membrane protein [Bacteroidota bacterium]|nr:RagB/SusD family nutrient uptake outer membrane protein [Bacteroidota bacterium]